MADFSGVQDLGGTLDGHLNESGGGEDKGLEKFKLGIFCSVFILCFGVRAVAWS
jgi:hypothetical protein